MAVPFCYETASSPKARCVCKAEIGGSLDCDGGRFKNAKSAALNAERAKISGAVLLRDGFESEGEVRLQGAEIGGSLECGRGSRIRNLDGRALNAEGAKIEGAVLLRNNFEAEGEVRLFGAEVGADLDCNRGRFRNAKRVALNAAGAKIAGNANLGIQVEGGISFESASIARDLTLASKWIEELYHNPRLSAKLNVQRANISGALNLVGMQTGPETEVNLSDASCDVLADELIGDSPSWPPNGKLMLDGFVYRRIEKPGRPADRLDWIRRQLPKEVKERRGRFRPQPYRQLASVLRAQGHDAEAKAVLIGMAKDRRKWAELGRASRAWQWALWITIRNGHQPLRALYPLLILWAIGFLAFGWGYQKHVMAPSDRFAYEELAHGRPLPGQYEQFCALVYAVDTALPIISLGQRDRWHPSAPPTKRGDSEPPGRVLLTVDPSPTPAKTGDSEPRAFLCEARFAQHWDPHGKWIESSTLATALDAFRWVYIPLGWFFATMLLAGVSGLVGRE